MLFKRTNVRWLMATGGTLVLAMGLLVRASEAAGLPPASEAASRATTTSDTNASLADEARRIAEEPRRNNPGRFTRIDALAARWMAHDPRGAMAYLAGLAPFERHRAGAAALSAWFDLDPTAAMKFAAELMRGNEDCGSWLEPVFEKLTFGTGAMRLDRLQAFFEMLPATENAFRGLAPTFVRIAKDDLVAAEAFAATLPVAEARDGLYSFVGMQKAQRGGVALLREIADGAATLPGRDAQVAAGLYFLIQQQFADVAAWVNAQPSAAYLDAVRGAMAWQYAPSDIEAAVKVANAIAKEEMRRSQVKRYLVAWLKRDSTRAEAWAQASHLPAADVAEAIEEAKAAMAKKPRVDYLARVEAALRLSDEKAARRQLWGDLPAWLEQDRAAALRWMEVNARNPDERQFFDSMIRRVPTEKPPPPKPGEVGDFSSF